MPQLSIGTQKIIKASYMSVVIIHGKRMEIGQFTESTVSYLHENLREAISLGHHVLCHVPEFQAKGKD
jgi:hypothetical protein